MSIAGTLLNQVLVTAQAAGLDQARLAKAAGVAPETISRAKKRGTIDLKSIDALARVAGLQLELVRDHLAAPNPQPPSERSSTLADPKWGLAWSNTRIDTGTLIRNALAKGGFALVLEAVRAHGLKEVMDQMQVIRPELKPRTQAELDRQLQNIAKGIANAQA